MRAAEDNLDELDLGRTAETMKATLRTSKIRSFIEDEPLTPPKEPVSRWRPRYWLTRLYLSLSVLSTFVAVFLLPGSATNLALHGSPTGWFFVGVCVALSIVGIADVVINDLMPPGWSAPFFRGHRHWVYNGIALSLLCFTYTIVRQVGWSPLLLAYADDLIIALVVAPLDLFARHRER